MPKIKKSLVKPLDYEPTKEEREAYLWGLDKYIIGPFGINGRPNVYRLGISVVGDHKNVKFDPKTYEHDEVMQKTYEYYKFYYDKRKDI